MNNEIGEKYLPVGTVVMLKGGVKRLMITGFCSVALEDEQEEIYDYNACLYPEGNIDSSKICLFNHDQIEKVYFRGFVDEEEVNFKKELAEKLSELSNETKVEETTEEVLDNNEISSNTLNEVSDLTGAPIMPNIEVSTSSVEPIIPNIDIPTASIEPVMPDVEIPKSSIEPIMPQVSINTTTSDDSSSQNVNPFLG